MTSLRTRLIAVSAAGLLLLTGCSFGGGSDPEGNTSAQGNQGGGTTSGDTNPGVAVYDPEDVIVSQEVTIPESDRDTATIGVHSLTVEGSVQVLRLVVTPHFKSKSASDSVNQYEVWGRSTFGPTLIDMDNLKQYSVIDGRGSRWYSDPHENKTINGEPMIVWAVFAAPEDDVASFDIRLHESWPEFTDIPVTR